ncbi:N-acetylmuramate alpha-1-phosphate uridylyltransferase MurU [Kushneria phyllosphaerae]|uniref:UTP--glucose-1-phosphate uridylyltransferase n=1 Tax=Kushneria phyllosphaerae TaxID=2100822 RepID=A0A2R8CL71_9GAMM|nr:nucleotidyltransferase family protein [Kushneria phyllosphaerae]SPJ33636.1 UTP--glucose-1-phosphate uridylyltransferase [Kushneria phyllosphaerae]
MKAMILAAGRGSRMRELTEHCPKPLLKVGGHALIEYHLERLRRAGITDIVINVSYLGDQIMTTLGDGARYGVQLRYSVEPTALETGGGIRHALPLLGNDPFWLVNADVWCDITPDSLGPLEGDLARLVMVDPPEHHRQGDFYLDDAGRLHEKGTPRLVYAGVALMHPSLVADLDNDTPCPLKPCLVNAMQQQRLGGYHHKGQWSDIGTPERLAALEQQLSHQDRD